MDDALLNTVSRIEAQDVDLYDFDLERDRLPIAKARDGKSEPFTFTELCDLYPTLTTSAQTVLAKGHEIDA